MFSVMDINNTDIAYGLETKKTRENQYNKIVNTQHETIKLKKFNAKRFTKNQSAQNWEHILTQRAQGVQI